MADLYPHGGYRFEETYDNDLSGIPMRRRDADRDYLDRLISKGEDRLLDRDEELKSFVHRTERLDVDP